MFQDLEGYLSSLPMSRIQIGETAEKEPIYALVPPCILADSAYGSTARVVPTFRNVECDNDIIVKALNAKLAAMRYKVEHAFGVGKKRWSILGKKVECAKFDIKTAALVILAALTLHNLVIDEESGNTDSLLYNIEERMVQERDVERFREEGGMPYDGPATREIFLQHMRWNQAKRKEAKECLKEKKRQEKLRRREQREQRRQLQLREA